VFIVCGSNGFHIRKVEKYIPPAHRGFTPHLVSLYKALDEKDWNALVQAKDLGYFI